MWYLFAFLLLAGLLGCGAPEAPPGAGVTAFTNATIFDGLEPIADAVMLVKDGLVTAVGPAGSFAIPDGAESVDLGGRFVTPGMVNGHGHPAGSLGLQGGPEVYTEENMEADLRLLARYGVTTVANLGGAGVQGVAVRNREQAAGMSRARIVDAGEIVMGPSADEARAQVDANAAAGVDLIKIRVDSFLGTREPMSAEAYAAVIDQAHKKGLPVAAHLYYLDDAKGLLKAGADFIAHSIRDKEVDDELIAMLKERDICVCPTLTREVSVYVYESTPEFFSDPFFLEAAKTDVLEQLKDPARLEKLRNDATAQSYKQALTMAQANLKKLADAGVRVVMGTDSGPPARFQGYFEHMELELMAEAGLTPEQVFRSATSDAANCLGLPKAGLLAPGRFADFVVYEKNPLEDVRNSRTIESVWMGGEKLAR